MTTTSIYAEKPKLRVTSQTIVSVKVTFDGENYTAVLDRNTMSGLGFEHWRTTHIKEIALGKAMCYSEHIQKFGNYGQIKPDVSEEYFTLQEVNNMKTVASLETSFDFDF